MAHKIVKHFPHKSKESCYTNFDGSKYTLTNQLVDLYLLGYNNDIYWDMTVIINNGPYVIGYVTIYKDMVNSFIFIFAERAVTLNIYVE